MVEKRIHPRVGIEIQVSCQLPGGASFRGMARDISIGGMFVESVEDVPFGTELIITGRLPGAKADLRLPAVVRWVKPEGFGVQFGLLGARETHAISELLQYGSAPAL